MMQRPRRTSEFQDELVGGSTIKRQRLIQTRQTTGLSPAVGFESAMKLNTRSSRSTIASRGRAGSLEQLNVQSSAIKRPSRLPQRKISGVSPAGSFDTAQKAATGRFGVTPQKPTTSTTPSQPNPRILFTTEKQRNISVGGALHNDKKWVQEHQQHIIEYLVQAARAGAFPGIKDDFFARSNCLRQMSIKQFVTIINYFLQFIWGNRLSVGTNHVDDIVNILQKLSYPHHINKSWLKTPNTAHSFGNVIVLLDFLLDFAPPQQRAFGDKENMSLDMGASDFPLQLLQETTSNLEEDLMPDLEFQEQLLQHAEESFSLWDKQLDDEFADLKRKSANALLIKRCEFPSIDALDEAMDLLVKQVDVATSQRLHIAAEDEEKCNNMKAQLRELKGELDRIKADFETGEKQLQESISKQSSLEQEITELEENNRKRLSGVNKQVCTPAEHQELVAHIGHLRQHKLIRIRAVKDLDEKDSRQQIQLSLMQKRLFDEIGKFNAYSRDLAFSDIVSSNIAPELELPMNVEMQHIEKLMTLLNHLKKRIQEKIKNGKAALLQYEERKRSLIEEIESQIEPKLKAQFSMLENAQENMKTLELNIKKERLILNIKRNDLDLEMKLLQSEYQTLCIEIAKKRQTLQKLQVENDEILTKAETDLRDEAKASYEIFDEVENLAKQCVETLGKVQLTDGDGDGDGEDPEGKIETAKAKK